MEFEYYEIYEPNTWLDEDFRQQSTFPAEYAQYTAGMTPMIAPPNFSPPFPTWQSGPQGIRRCLYRNTYIWLTNGNSFWFFPTFISRNSLIGFRWNVFGWTRSFIDLRRIRNFQCF